MKDALKFNNNIKELEDRLLENKNIENVIFSDPLTKIGHYTFASNKLKTVKFNESLKYIGKYSFINNQIEQLYLNDNLNLINVAAFQSNNIKELNIPSGVTLIGDRAFADNLIETLHIPGNVKKIFGSAFSNNNIKELKIEEGVEQISASAFAYNKIEKVVFPKSLEHVSIFSFEKNNLKEIVINNEQMVFDVAAFDNNKNLESAHVLIDDEYVSLDKYDLDKIGVKTDLLINYAKFKKCMINSPHEFKNIPLEAVECLKANRVNANMIRLKTAKYENFKNRIHNYQRKNNIHLFYLPDIFKYLYMFDFFRNGNEEEIFNSIIKYNKVELKEITKNINLQSVYNENKINLLDKIVNDARYYDDEKLIKVVYEDYKNISKYIKSNYKEIIHSKLKRELKILLEKDKRDYDDLTKLIDLKVEIQNKERSIEKITIDDALYYLDNNIYFIKKGNEKLKAITPYLKGISQADFEKLEYLYEQSKGITKNFEKVVDNSESFYSYQWSKGDNPYNLVLGYIVDCCAKLNGAGESVMIESMLNENIMNLLVRDENLNIVAKATAYLNQNYILFNNVESIASADKKEIMETIKRASKEQVDALSKNGIIIDEVRIGIMRGGIFNKDNIKTLYYDLLDNYEYENYDGDAYISQGILYESLEKTKHNIKR